jgi:DNA-binding SARP family transcriptional activator
MSLLALCFLGSPRVKTGKATVRISRRKVMALLAYLAVSEQHHSRDELAELLFGKKDRAHALASLRQTLSLLRSSIGAEHLRTDRLSVWISRTGKLWVDVSEFQNLQEKWKASAARGNMSSGVEHLAEAARLYRGDFLSGFYLRDSSAFENWQLMMQENLRLRQISTLRRLAEIHEVSGRFEQAIEYLQKLLAVFSKRQ